MQAKSLFLVVTLLLIQSCYSQLYYCMDKSIIEDDNKLVATNGDVNLAYNEVGSCATLQTLEDDDDDGEDDLHFCCYAKLKIKNPQLEQKFTLKGCLEIPLEKLVDPGLKFKDFKKEIEGYIEENNPDIEVKKLDIDCGAGFLHIVGISLLFFLL